MRRSVRIIAIASACILITGCAKQKENAAEKKGKIVLLESGLARLVSEAQQQKICSQQKCEDNFVYHASFGSKRRRDGDGRRRPAPDPTPVPTPQPPEDNPQPAPPQPVRPAPDPASELIDYDLTIMRVPEAWNISKGSGEIIVAVIDTGVDIAHPDLRNNIWRNEAEFLGMPNQDDDGNGYVDDIFGYDFANDRPNGIDDHNHGTHCAGIIAAELNGFGAAGVAPKVKIMPIKFLSANGSGTTENAINAIRYAIDNGADVISNSWGGGGRSQFLDDVIQEAQNRGILVVAAAGNDSNDNDSSATYPANYEGVISVAASNQSDELAYFSNYGESSVTIAAPGQNIYSTVMGAEYRFFSGTSMAAPQVSGALALSLSLGNLSPAKTKAALCSSAASSLQNVTRCGRLDVLSLMLQSQ